MKINGWWRGIESIGNFESYNIDFSDIDFLQFLHDNPFKLPELIRVITDKTMEYINRHEKTLITILSLSRKIKETQF